MKDTLRWTGIAIGIGTFAFLLFPRQRQPVSDPIPLPEAEASVASTPEDLRREYAWANRIEEEIEIVQELLRVDPDRREMRMRILDLLSYAGRPAEGRSHAWWLVRRGARSDRLKEVFLASRDAAGLTAALENPLDQARALVAIGAQPEAMASYQAHLSEHPDDSEARLQLAHLYLWNDQPMEAARQLEAVPTEEARLRLRELYRDLNRTDLLLAHEPDSADLLESLGRTEEAKERYEAQGNLPRLLQLAEGTQSDTEILAIRERLEPTPENRLAQAALYRWRKDFDKAIELYVEAHSEEAIDLLLPHDLPRAYRLAAQWGLEERRKELDRYFDEIGSSIRELQGKPSSQDRLIQLYLRAGLRTEAIGRMEPPPSSLGWEGLAVAGRGEEAAFALEREASPNWDRVAARIAVSDPATALRLESVLARRSRAPERHWRAVLSLARRLGLRDVERRCEEELLRLDSDNAPFYASVGLQRSDLGLLKHADALGKEDGEILRRLAELSWEQGNADASLEYYRRYHQGHPGDAVTLQAQAHLSGDREDCLRALATVPPSEARTQGDFHVLLEEWKAAEEAYARAGNWDGVFETRVAAGDWNGAQFYASSDRQRGRLAFHRGDLFECADFLLKAESPEASERRMLAESLFLLGYWQEAERWADEELRTDIEGAYGSEGSWSAGFLSLSEEDHASSSLRYRTFFSEAWDLNVGTDVGWWTSPEESADVESVGARLGFTRPTHLRVEMAAAAWQGPESTWGTLELDFEFREKIREPAWRFGASAVWHEAWTELLAAVLREGRRDRLRLFGGGLPWERCTVQGYVEYRWLFAEEEGKIPGDDFGEQTAAGILSEIRIWGGKGSAGRHFFEFELRSDHRIETQVSLELGAAYWAFQGDERLLASIPLLEETLILWVGPSLGYAEKSWGIQGKLFAGADPIRALAFGRIWIASVEGLWTIDRWKVAGRFEFLQEALATSSDSAWGITLGIHHHF